MIHNIPWTAPVEPAPHGLLQSPDLVTWSAYGVVLLLAWLSMPTGLKTAAAGLYAPIAAFLRRLYVPWLWGGLFVWSALSGAFLAPFRVLESIFRMVWSWGREQLRRLAFPGFVPPIVT